MKKLHTERRSLLKKVYDSWMKFGRVIGNYVTKGILGILYYTIFTIYGLVGRALRKDLLDLKLEKHSVSYWHKIEVKPFKKEDYRRQF
jgi:hypothetical protein